MNGSDDSENDEIVGYGRPPVATRFQKGKSGNPKGRPKGRKGVGNMILDALYRQVDVREGGRVRSMPKIEAAIEVALNKTLQGNLCSFAKLVDVAAKLATVERLPNEQNMSYDHAAAAASAIETIERSIERMLQADIEYVNENDAAPGRNSKPEKS